MNSPENTSLTFNKNDVLLGGGDDHEGNIYYEKILNEWRQRIARSRDIVTTRQNATSSIFHSVAPGRFIKKSEDGMFLLIDEVDCLAEIDRALSLRIPVHHHDIWCKRGNGAKCHPGNLFYGDLIDACFVEYAQTNKSKVKSQIAQNIFEKLNERTPPARFLREVTNGERYFLNNEECLEKIKQALRDKIKVTSLNEYDIEPLPIAYSGSEDAGMPKLESFKNMEEFDERISVSLVLDSSNGRRSLGGSLKESSMSSGTSRAMQHTSQRRLCQSLPCGTFDTDPVVSATSTTDHISSMGMSVSSASYRNLISSLKDDFDKSIEPPQEVRSFRLPREAELGRTFNYETISDQTMGTFDVSLLSQGDSTRSLMMKD